MQIKEIWPKQIPAIVEKAIAWTGNTTTAGAGTLFGHLMDGDVDPNPDEIARRAGAAKAQRLCASLKQADLYSVTARKTKDVLAAAEQFPADMEVRREYFNSDHGFMVFERGIQVSLHTVSLYLSDAALRASPIPIRLFAMSWRIFSNTIQIFVWAPTDNYLRTIRDHAQVDAMRDPLLKQRIEQVGPLTVCGERYLKLENYMRKAKSCARVVDDVDILSPLLSACLMMRQTVTAKSEIYAPRTIGRYSDKPDMNEQRKVTIIDARPFKHVSPPADESSKRKLSVRYDVKGHWRTYTNSRFSEEVRANPIWIPPHWVGDESLPMIDRTKVTRLKR